MKGKEDGEGGIWDFFPLLLTQFYRLFVSHPFNTDSFSTVPLIQTICKLSL